MKRDQPVEEHDPELPRAGGSARPRRARASRGRRRPRRETTGSTSRSISEGRCWPSASRVTTISRAGVGHQPVAGPQRRAAAAVDHVPRDHGAVPAPPSSPVSSREPSSTTRTRSLPRRPRAGSVEHLADALGLVVGGDHDARSCPRKRSGWPASRNSSQASPSSTAESCGDPRRSAVSARTTSRNRIRIANTATPTIRVPFERLNEKALRIVSRSSVPETIARPSATRAGAARRRSSERRRQIAKPRSAAARHEPDRAQRGQLGREERGEDVDGKSGAR